MKSAKGDLSMPPVNESESARLPVQYGSQLARPSSQGRPPGRNSELTIDKQVLYKRYIYV